MSREETRRIFPRWLIALAVIGGVLWLFLHLKSVLTPVFFAAGIAYMLDPVVDRLEARKIPRALAIVILLAGVLVFLALVGLLVVPGVVREVGAFVGDLPAQLNALLVRLEPWLRAQGVEPPHSVKEALDQFGVDAKDVAGKAAAPAGAVLAVVLGGTASVLGALGNLLIIPVFAFYLLHDWDVMVAKIRQLIPWRIRPHVVDIAGEVDEILGQFLRGQLLVMLMLAVLYAVAYSLIGVRLAIPIGIVAGLLAFIPYVGGAVALGLALLMTLLAGQGWTQVGLVVGAYAVIQVLEGFVITPRIMEDKLGLGAVWVLLALMVFGELFGFMGVLLAVPAAAVTKVFALRAVAYYKKSALFLDGGPDPDVASRRSVLVGILKETGVEDSPETAAAKHAAETADEASAADAGDVAAGPGSVGSSPDAVVREVAEAPQRTSPPEETAEDDAETADAEPDGAEADAVERDADTEREPD
ncbi:MAG: AI-2E family transporter [Polyangiaceae bacterium]|nr:AI-2E family transporter [Myxococcales bacterium]MCB9584604.1 AI-2E family transporter [Polyangiaceae bacterium]